MAKTPSTKSDPLTQAARTREGEPQETASGREKADELVAEAREALPAGLPEDSPWADKAMTRDKMLQESAKLGITLAVFISEDDLRFVLEHERQIAIAKQVSTAPQGSEPRPEPPPVPQPPPDKPRIKLRGVPESETGMWITRNEQPKNVSLQGQMCVIHANSIIERRHYGDAQLQAIADSGVKLEPYTPEE